MARLEKRNTGRDPSISNRAAGPQDVEGGGSLGHRPQRQAFKEQVEQTIGLLWRRKWIVLLTCLFVVAGAAAHTYSKPPLYRTSGLVLVEKEEGSGAEEGTDVSSLGSESPNSESGNLLARRGRSLESELVVLRNSGTLRRSVAQQLIERGVAGDIVETSEQSQLGRLADRVQTAAARLLGSGGSDGTREDPTPGTRDSSLSVSTVAASVGGRISFSANEERGVIRVTAQDESPKVAAILANVYIEQYVNATRKASRARLRASRRFLEKQLRERRQQLQAVEQKIQEFRREGGSIVLDKQEGSLVSRITDVETKLEEARLELRLEKEALRSLEADLDSIRPEQLSQRAGSDVEKEIEALNSKIATLKLSKQELLLQADSPTAADSAYLAQVERRIQKLQEKVSERADKYVRQVTTGGLDVEATAKRINELKRQVAEKRLNISELKSRIEVLSKRLEEFRAKLNALPEKSLRLAQLKREQKFAQRMYSHVAEQLQHVRLQEQTKLDYAEKLSTAGVPGRPIRPNPSRALFFAVILGLLGGGGLALLRETMDSRFYRPDRLGEKGYPELGMIPNLTPLVQDRFEGRELVERGGQQLATSLVAAVAPYSAAAEAYRRVRTNLQSGRPERASGTLLVTSPGTEDGKSVTAANLAIVQAQAGNATLLIDADLRRPRQHKLFSIGRSPGLAEILQGEDLNGQMPNGQTESSAIENLFLLPAGRWTDGPPGGHPEAPQAGNLSEALSSPRCHEFLLRAEQHFDAVILDTPPVLAASETSSLASRADATLCVVRAGLTREPEIERTMDILREVDANVSGVVFNGFDVSMAYGYKYRYRHYSKYGPYDQYQSLPEST